MDAVIRKNKELTRVGSLFGLTQFCYAEKPRGTEPGFRAIDLNAVFFQELVKILADEHLPAEPILTGEARADLCNLRRNLAAPPGDLTPPQDLARKQNLFNTFISTLIKGPHEPSKTPPGIQWLCNEIKEAVAASTQLSAWMYKFDYAEGQKERIKTNKEALREYVGTYLARMFSEQNQKQELFWLKNGEKDCHALLACGWKNGLQDLTSFLVGGSEPDYKGILVENKEAVIKRSKYIPGLGKNLIFAIATSDRDAIGKEAQNKGFADGAFYGFDYGKAYEGSEVCSSLQDDFSFEDYYAKTPSLFRSSFLFGIARHLMYRNYSVFYDTDLSERMFGFHVLRKMITGDNPSDEISASYPGLKQELQRIDENTPSVSLLVKQLCATRIACGEDKRLFLILIDTYINMLSEENSSPFNLYFTKIKIDLLDAAVQQGMPYEELIDYIKFINEMAMKATSSNQQILAVFNKRALLTKEEIDLLDKLERYFSPSSIKSPDGKVILNHLRIESAGGRIPFQLAKEEDGSCTLSTSNTKLISQLSSELGLAFVLTNEQLSCTIKAAKLRPLIQIVQEKLARSGDLEQNSGKIRAIPGLLVHSPYSQNGLSTSP
ncbi:hypothetical protein [Legionella sp. km772]|uniref:hypothetical protein n=1 Tax=Legionella sp. km772 TaxID=2498111 RepID=UPI000F8C579F|nr:hypothetical protein [Legionella sp. km772]RUR05546.1 hypothetical protein ELY15_14215 [Legionella sp. km772]